MKRNPHSPGRSKTKRQANVRESFVRHFGENQAKKFEGAAREHANGINDKEIGDPFKWAILICIGYQCAEVEGYREHHGITASWPKIKSWIKQNGKLSTYKGDLDYLSLMCGTYNEYVNKPRLSPRKKNKRGNKRKQ